MRRVKSSIPLLLAVILASCGGSGGGTSRPTTSPSTSTPSAVSPAADRASYIAKADALCKSSNARQEVLRRQAKGLAITKLVPILRQQAKIASGLSTALGKLAPPAGDRVAVGRFVAAVHSLSVYSLAVANSIAAKHAFAAKALATKLGVARQQETLLGQGYGYKICASGKSY